MLYNYTGSRYVIQYAIIIIPAYCTEPYKNQNLQFSAMFKHTLCMNCANFFTDSLRGVVDTDECA